MMPSPNEPAEHDPREPASRHLEPEAAGGDMEAAAAEAAIEQPRWSALVERIRDNDNEAMEELYQVFSRGIRYYLCRHLGPQELDDKVHDTFLIVVQSIQSGALREPERLMGFVRTIVRRQVAAFIDQAVQSRRDFADLEVGGRVPDLRQNPEQKAIQEQRTNLMIKVLRGISQRDREILTRFYLYEQSQEQICEEMNLTDTQFRLLKSRAKARFGELGKRRLAVNPLMHIFRQATGSGS